MTEAETPASRHPWERTAWLATGAALLLLAVVIFRFRRTPFQWNLFLATFTGVDWRWLCLAILLILLTYFGRALRWEIMLRPLTRDASLWRLTTATAIGFTAVVLLGRAGELVRPYLISLSSGIPFSSQAAAWLLERMLDLLVVLLLFGFALTRIHTHNLPVGPSLQWVLGVGGYLITALGAAC